MINESTEDGIERFIKYIHRMSKLNNEQLRIFLETKYAVNPECYTSIGIDVQGHMAYIHEMAKYDDNTLRAMLRKSAEDPIFNEVFEDANKKKAIKVMSDMAKDIYGNPKLFARKVA